MFDYIQYDGMTVELDLSLVKGGILNMGSPDEESFSTYTEKPQHMVWIRSFYMGRYPVTQAQWRTVASFPKVERDLDPDPSYFKGDYLPVEQVSWEDAIEFCSRLSAISGSGYRLPTEAEWEYACRARTHTAYNFGDEISSELVNYDYGGGHKKQTSPVGSFPPNSFGLYDMHGNVWEWCLDHWHDNYHGAPTDERAWLSPDLELGNRVIRGGSWTNNFYPVCRSASRYWFFQSISSSNIGFRVVSSIASYVVSDVVSE